MFILLFFSRHYAGVSFVTIVARLRACSVCVVITFPAAHPDWHPVPTSDGALAPSAVSGSRLTLHECVECGGSSEQHLLALCDTCHHHYHLTCLDPPLTRMPRKSKNAGWECWRCAAAGSRAQSPEPAPDAPRGVRRARQAAAVNMQVSDRGRLTSSVRMAVVRPTPHRTKLN